MEAASGTAESSRRTAARYGLGLVVFLFFYLTVAGSRSSSLISDDTDPILFSQTLELGYHEQPPLYTWLAWLVFRVLGLSHFSLALLKTLLLGGLFAALYMCARTLLSDPGRAAIAVASVALMPNFLWNAVAYLTHTVLVCLLATLTFLVFARVVRDGRTRDYAALGAGAALGILSKYNYLIFLASLLLSAATLPSVRRRLGDARMLLAGAIVVAAVMPHTAWVVQHRAEIAALARWKAKLGAEAGTAALAIRGLLSLACNVVLCLSPLVPAAVLLFWGDLRRPSVKQAANAELRRLLERTILVGLWLFAALVIAARSGHVHERWLQPFALLAPLAMWARLASVPLSDLRLRWTARAAVLAAVVTALAWAAQTIGGWYVFGEYDTRMSFHGAAKQIRDAVGADVIVSEDRMVGANLRLLLPETRHLCTAHPLYVASLRPEQRVVLVWNVAHGKRRPPPLARLFISRQLGLRLPPWPSMRYLDVPGARGNTRLAYTVLESGDFATAQSGRSTLR